MPSFCIEDALDLTPGGHIAGIDEAGRGSLAGPVTAAAIVLDRRHCPPALLAAIDDSKRLSRQRRTEVSERLTALAAVGTGWAERQEIDELNILQATILAMQRAITDLARRLGKPPDHALVDGNRCPALPCPATAVVRGDQLSFSIAAASIVAKTARDDHMTDLASRYPGYGWERNAGYGTAVHLAALRDLGPTSEHRRRFAPVAAIVALRETID